MEKLLEDKDHTLQLRQVEIEHLRHQHQEQVEVRGNILSCMGGEAAGKQWGGRARATNTRSKWR